MLKKITLFTSLLLIGVASIGQKIYSPIFKERQFIDWVIKKDSIHNLVDESLIMDESLLNKIFSAVVVSKNDSLNMLKQVRKFKGSNFKNWNLREIKIIDKASIPQLNKEPYGPPDYYRLSPPLFFNKGRHVAIIIENYCGNLCGSGILIIYKVKDGKYEIEFLDKLWIS